MKFACNIDAQGRKARLITGIVVDVVGIALALAGSLTGTMITLIAGAVLSFAGSFMILEGLTGWCVLRALGFKTKM